MNEIIKAPRDEKQFNELNYQRIKILYKKYLPVHVFLKNGRFYNGYVIEVSDDYFEIQDRKTGNQIVFYCELKKDVEEYKEVGK